MASGPNPQDELGAQNSINSPEVKHEQSKGANQDKQPLNINDSENASGWEPLWQLAICVTAVVAVVVLASSHL